MNSDTNATPIRKAQDSVFSVLFFMTLFVIVPIVVFTATKEKIPHDSELSFIEHSEKSDYVGSVIPASCESNPPTNHGAGDCPASVSVNLSTVPNNINFIFTVSSPEGAQVVRHGSAFYWTFGNGATWISTNINARVGFTATGATGCSRSDQGYSRLYPPANEFFFNVPSTIYSNVPVSYTIACTDGTHWVTTTFGFYGYFYEPSIWDGSSGGSD